MTSTQKGAFKFEMDTIPGDPAPAQTIIRIVPGKLEELRCQQELILQKGLTRPSSSPFGSPVFFVKHTNEELQRDCDYMRLNVA